MDLDFSCADIQDFVHPEAVVASPEILAFREERFFFGTVGFNSPVPKTKRQNRTSSVVSMTTCMMTYIVYNSWRCI